MEGGGNQSDKQAPSGATISVPIPAFDENLYRYEATDTVLHRLADTPEDTYTIRGLSRLTPYSHSAVRDAVDVLETNDLITVTAEGNRKSVTINRSRLSKPDDPILEIPQTEFHEPVRLAVDQLHAELEDIRGILCFGSVARGEADRRSDIDLWILVQKDRATNQRIANEIGRELGERRIGGDRYEYQILVESARSALNYRDRITDVLVSSISLYETETLRRYRREVLTNVD